MIHLIFVTKYRNKDRNNLKLHRKIAPKWGRSFLIKSVKLDPFAECDAILKILIYLALQFQSTPSLRKVTARIAAIRTAQTFQSTPSLRKVTGAGKQNCQSHRFQSTPSLRKVTLFSAAHAAPQTISIHTFLTEGDFDILRSSTLICISIHTFLTEGDGSLVWHTFLRLPISIHTFLTEGDQASAVIQKTIIIFQSTPSLRKVTPLPAFVKAYPHISIHTFLTEGDVNVCQYDQCALLFQSTPSLRKVTA